MVTVAPLNIIHPRTQVSDPPFDGNRDPAILTLKRRCSSRTFRYGYLVTT